MTRRAIGVVVVASVGGLVALPAAAEDGGPRSQLEIGAGFERLSAGASDWRQHDAAWRHRPLPRTLFEVTLRRTQRGGVDDHEVGGSVSWPIASAWQLGAGASLSPTHAALPRHGLRLDLSRILDGGWVGTATLAQRRFDRGVGTTQASVGLERYLGPWRGAVALGSTRLTVGGSAPTLRLQLDRSFAAERGRIGVVVSRGRELEGLPATPSTPADVLAQRVDTVAVVATLPLADRWALTGEAGHVRNRELRRRSGSPAGPANERSGARLGVRHDF